MTNKGKRETIRKRPARRAPGPVVLRPSTNFPLGRSEHPSPSTQMDRTLTESASDDLDINKSSSRQLGQLLESLEDTTPDWQPADLGAILSHQLSAPMVFDFCATIHNWVAAEERSWPHKNQGAPSSFFDLFHHLSPSKRLLQLTKEFAKANWEHPDSALPPEVALVLYYTSIAVALVRHGKWITRLRKPGLQRGFTWVTMQPWIDADTKNICRDALKSIGSTHRATAPKMAP